MGRSLLPWVVLSLVLLLAAVFLLRDVPERAVEIGSSTTLHEEQREVDLTATERVSARSAPEIPAMEQLAESESEIRWSETDARITNFLGSQGPFSLTVRVVHDEDGRPFARASVHVRDSNELDDGAARQTDANGVAQFDELTTGPRIVVADAAGCATMRSGVRLGRDLPAANVELRLTRLHTVLVRMVDAGGRDLALAELGFDADSLGEFSVGLGAECAPTGTRFAASDGPPCRARRVDTRVTPCAWNLEISGSDPVCAHALLGDLVLATAPIDPWTDDVLLRIDAAMLQRALAPIRVRVVAEGADVPVVRALVSLGRVAGHPIEQATDDEGRARFEGVAAGDVVASVRAEGYAELQRVLRRPLDDEVVLRLSVGRRVDGLVVDQTGAPMSRAKISLYAADDAGSSRPARILSVLESGADGRFEFTGLAPGQYAVSTLSGTGYTVLPRVSDWGDRLRSADCRSGDARGLVVNGFRYVNDVSGPDWNPAPFPRK